MLYTEGIIVPEQYIWNHSVFNTFTWRPIITQSEVEESPLGAFAFRLTPWPERTRCPGLPTWDRLRECKHVIPQTHTYRHTRACLQRNKQLSGNFEIHRKRMFPLQSQRFSETQHLACSAKREPVEAPVSNTLIQAKELGVLQSKGFPKEKSKLPRRHFGSREQLSIFFFFTTSNS